MGHLCHISEFKHDRPSRITQYSFLIIIFPDRFMAKSLARRGNANASFINRYEMCHWKIANRHAERSLEIYTRAPAALELHISICFCAIAICGMIHNLTI